MANYECVVISNYFRAKNPQEVVDVFCTLGYENSFCDTTDNTVILASYEQCWDSEHVVIVRKDNMEVIGAVQNCDYDFLDLKEYLEDLENGLTEDDVKILPLYDYIQYQLLDKNTYFAVKETGNEKLRYNVAHAEVITKNSMKWFNLDTLILEYIEEEMSIDE